MGRYGKSHHICLSALPHLKIPLMLSMVVLFVAALREMFRCKSGEFSLSGELMRDIVLPHSEEDIKKEVRELEESIPEDEAERPHSKNASLMEMQDAADEFFDVPEPSDYDQLENEWSSEPSPELQSPVLRITVTRIDPTCFKKELN